MTEARIYLDYHATTPVDPRVVDVVVHHMTTAFGNASSRDHAYGDEAERAVESAAAEVARLVGADARDVVFTSGATEATNLALKGIAWAAEPRLQRPLRIGLMPVEHHAVLNTCEYLEQRGLAQLSYFRVDTRAQLDLEDYRSKVREGLDLVVLMAANNEVGTIYPLRDAAAIAKSSGALVFSDATQAAGRIPLEFSDWDIDLLALSAHKMYGPKGVGALLVRNTLRIDPGIHGGQQQSGMRAGTLNVPGIAGFGEAARLRFSEMERDELRIASQRDRFQDGLVERCLVAVNGDLDSRLSGNLHVSFEGIPNGALVARLRDKIAFSTGAACSSGIESPSHVLRAIELPQIRVEGAVRFGIGKFTEDADLDRALHLIDQAVAEVVFRLRHDQSGAKHDIIAERGDKSDRPALEGILRARPKEHRQSATG
jgi:cysteine desulfurase